MKISSASQQTLIIALGFLLFLVFFLECNSSAGVPDVVLKQKRAVVTIYINDKEGNEIATGSGFIVTSNGIIATNYHVISKLLEENSRSSIIKMENGAYYPVKKIVSFDEDNDIALIQVEGKELATLKLAKNYRPKQGDSITVIGSPFGLETTVSDGIISSVRGAGGLIQITAPISPGSSGSPVFNQKGEAIGIATFLIQGGQNLNFAIPVKHVVNLLSEPKKQKSHGDISKSVEKPSEAPPPIPGSDVRVRDNGWLRIIDEVLLKQTSEDFYKNVNDEKNIELKKIIKQEMDEGKIYRTVGVKIEFLKPCTATFKLKDDDIGDPGELFPWLSFRCNYRLKIFITFYSKNGVEIGERYTIPDAGFENNSWKKEMIPSERMWIKFLEIPDDAAYWKVWLPK